MRTNYKMETKLTPEQALQIERDHNVYIDRDFGLFNCDSRGAVYGWWLIPDGWIDQVTEDTKTTLVDVVKRACEAERDTRKQERA